MKDVGCRVQGVGLRVQGVGCSVERERERERGREGEREGGKERERKRERKRAGGATVGDEGVAAGPAKPRQSWPRDLPDGAAPLHTSTIVT